MPTKQKSSPKNNSVNATTSIVLDPEIMRGDLRNTDLFCFGMMLYFKRGSTKAYPGDILVATSKEIESNPKIEAAFELFTKLRNFEGTVEDETNLFDIIAANAGVNRTTLGTNYKRCLQAARTITSTLKNSLYDAEKLTKEAREKLDALKQETETLRKQTNKSCDYKCNAQSASEQAALKTKAREDVAALTEKEKERREQIQQEYEIQRKTKVNEQTEIIDGELNDLLSTKGQVDGRKDEWKITGVVFPGKEKLDREKETLKDSLEKTIKSMFFPNVTLSHLPEGYKVVTNKDGSQSVLKINKTFNDELCKITTDPTTGRVHIGATIKSDTDAEMFAQNIIAHFPNKKVTLTFSEEFQYKDQIREILENEGFEPGNITFRIRGKNGVIKPESIKTALQELLERANTEEERQKRIKEQEGKNAERETKLITKKSEALKEGIKTVTPVDKSTTKLVAKLGNLVTNPEATAFFAMECQAVARDPAAALDVLTQVRIEETAHADLNIANVLMVVGNLIPAQPAGSTMAQLVGAINALKNASNTRNIRDQLENTQNGSIQQIIISQITNAFQLPAGPAHAHQNSIIYTTAVALRDSLQNVPQALAANATPEQTKEYERKVQDKKKEVLAHYEDFVNAQKAHTNRNQIAQKITATIDQAPELMAKDLNAFIQLVKTTEDLREQNKDFAHALTLFSSQNMQRIPIIGTGPLPPIPGDDTDLNNAFAPLLVSPAHYAVPPTAIAPPLPPYLDKTPQGEKLTQALEQLKIARNAHRTLFAANPAANMSKVEEDIRTAANELKKATEEAKQYIKKQESDLASLVHRQNVRNELSDKVSNMNPQQLAKVLIAANNNDPKNRLVIDYIKCKKQLDLLTAQIAQLTNIRNAQADALNAQLLTFNPIPAGGNNICRIIQNTAKLQELQQLQQNVQTQISAEITANHLIAAEVTATETQFKCALAEELQKTPEGEKVLRDIPDLAKSLQMHDQVILIAYFDTLKADLESNQAVGVTRLQTLFPDVNERQKVTNRLKLAKGLLENSNNLKATELQAMNAPISVIAAAHGGHTPAAHDLTAQEINSILEAAEKVAVPEPNVSSSSFSLRTI